MKIQNQLKLQRKVSSFFPISYPLATRFRETSFTDTEQVNRSLETRCRPEIRTAQIESCFKIDFTEELDSD